MEQGTISGKLAKTVFEDMVASGRDPEAIIKEKGLVQISDSGALEAIAQEIIDANPKEAADFKAGKTKVHGLLRGPIDEKDPGAGESAAGQRDISESYWRRFFSKEMVGSAHPTVLFEEMVGSAHPTG